MPPDAQVDIEKEEHEPESHLGFVEKKDQEPLHTFYDQERHAPFETNEDYKRGHNERNKAYIGS